MTTDNPVVLLMGDTVCENRALIEQHLTVPLHLEEWRPNDGNDVGAEKMRGAFAIVTGGEALMKGPVFKEISSLKDLKLWQITFTGYEWLDFSTVPKGCVVANAYGHEIAMAEYVLGAMLAREKNLAEVEASFRTGSWKHRGVADETVQQGELLGKTLGLVGFGAIARETAARAAAFGMDVIAVSRSTRETTPPLRWYGTMERLDDLMKECDYAVLTCELNDETRGLIRASQLELLGPSGTLVNVARGEVVDEDDLHAVLSSGRLGGAILDVWYQYPNANPPNPESGGPAPSKHDFAALKNVVMTPHCSANTKGTEQRRFINIAKNLNAVAKGQRPSSYVGEGK